MGLEPRTTHQLSFYHCPWASPMFYHKKLPEPKFFSGPSIWKLNLMSNYYSVTLLLIFQLRLLARPWTGCPPWTSYLRLNTFTTSTISLAEKESKFFPDLKSDYFSNKNLFLLIFFLTATKLMWLIFYTTNQLEIVVALSVERPLNSTIGSYHGGRKNL